MEPSTVSNRRTNASPEPTAEEIEAGACLTRPPERPEGRDTDEPPPPTPAVQSLVDKHEAAAPSQIFPPTNAGVPAAGTSAHRGIALSFGVNFAVGPIAAVGGELSVGVVVDLTDPDISVFASDGRGSAEATGVSAGFSGQVSYVHDLAKLLGSGVELGLNAGPASLAANFARTRPGAVPELNGGTLSVGPSIGADVHLFETRTEHVSVILNDMADAVRQMASLPGPRRFGP